MSTLQLTRLFDGTHKVDLPEEMLQSMLNANAFTSPLIFRIDTGDERHVYAGVREFTSASGEFSMNTQMAAQLGMKCGDAAVIERAELPKGTELTLDVLTAHTADLDFKSLLESWIPKNYTALAVGDELEIEYLGQSHRLKVASLKPEVEAVCVLETDMDLVVNGPPKALEAGPSDRAINSADQSPAQTTIDLNQPVTSSAILTGTTPDDLDFLYFSCSEVGMIGPEHATSDSSFIAISDNEEVKVSTQLLGPKFSVLGDGTLTVATVSSNNNENDMSSENGTESSADCKKCNICGKNILSRNYVLHTSVCARNSVECTECGRRFDQTRQLPESHKRWHELVKNQRVLCNTDGCSYEAYSLADLGLHRATDCRNKPILCRFCHLLQPQEETTSIDRAMGLTAHESQCGNRTTTCYICSKRVRMRSLDTHIKDHEMQRKLQPVPAICSNNNCPNPYPQARDGLCSSCFGPLSVPGSNNDPEKLKQRIRRRYVLQMMQGCKKPWCMNQYCAMNQKRSAKEAMELTAEIMRGESHWFCVNQESTQRRMFVDFDENAEYAKGWRALAISQCGSETEATQWLLANAN